jgi:Transposase DDE domain
MILSSVFERFVQHSPISLMARVSMQFALGSTALDELFEAKARRQYTRELLFSSVVDVMSLVVSRIRPSVHAAYQAGQDRIAVSVKALYDKLSHMEPDLAAALVEYSADRLRPVIRAMRGTVPPLLPGYRVRVLDGNHLAKTDRRLKELREVNGGALPGQVLCVLDPEYRLVTHALPIEDAHAQERASLPAVLPLVRKDDVWIADRNLCTAQFLLGIAERLGFFVIRQHAQTFHWKRLGRRRRCGRSDTGLVYEQAVQIKAPDGRTLRARRITVHLNEPTRDGERVLHLLSNLPKKVTARRVAALYRKRWTIETAFADLAKTLDAEIDTLAYPKAALFGFCVALVAANVQATVMAALRAAHGWSEVEDKVSLYYVADEIAGTYRGMMIAVPEEHWRAFEDLGAQELARLLKQWAGEVRLAAFRKHRRGPKKTRGKKRRGKFIAHVSTARVLAERKQKRKRAARTRRGAKRAA